jgi:hypothetical protein
VTVTDERRPRRSDAGQMRVTPRDVEAMAWLEDMRVVSDVELVVLLSRITGRERLLSDAAARHVVSRWQKLGYAKRGRLLVSTPPFTWLTAEGAAQVSDAEWREPTWPVMAHASAVARARLWLEGQADPEWQAAAWVSERRYRRQEGIGARDRTAVPDGVMRTVSGREVAVEAELSSKGSRDTADKLRALLRKFDWVLFLVTSDQVERMVRSAVQQIAQDQADGGAYDKVAIARLPDRLDR